MSNKNIKEIEMDKQDVRLFFTIVKNQNMGGVKDET